MKNKAFTLTELLGVIVILGILALVTFPNIASHIGKAKKELKEGTKTLIIDAAKDYYEDNKNDYDQLEGMTYCIDIDTLTNNNYLNKKIKDENLNDIDTSKKVKLIYHNNNFEYQVTDTCNNALTRNNIEVPIVTEDSGLYKSQIAQDRFIYRGGDPINNWIELNEGTEETPNYVKYRIISFEPDRTVKVVRNESIDNISWDAAGNRNEETDTYCASASTNGCNVWGNQTNTLFKNSSLDENFYYSYYPDQVTKELSNGPTGKVTKDASLNEFLNKEWLLNKKISDFIEIHKFNVGGIFYTINYKGGDKGLLKEKDEEKLYTWNGKVGLLNITEYVESSLNSNCVSVYSNYYYALDSENNLLRNNLPDGVWPCKINNYNNKNYNQFFLTVDDNSRNNIWLVDRQGYFLANSARLTAITRPSFYLKPSISLTGQGSEENPYRIVGEA